MYKEHFKKLLKHRSSFIGITILSILILGAIVCPMLTKATYYETHLALKNKAPCLEHLFGTDELGRSMFARIWWGARISLFIGITAALIDMVIGVFYGAFSGLMGGKIDDIMMRIVDVFQAIPNLLMVILLMVILGQGIFTIIIAMTITGWLNMARIVRAQILSLKNQDFVTAAYGIGASHLWILTKHLIPSCSGSIITTVTLTIPAAIFTEAFLSFLGLGVQAPIASWGTMASDGLSALSYFPWRLFFPAFFISITMLAFNLLGDGLRDIFDPRFRS
ncbi:MAG: ABC transporter permease [Chlamydiae bacterium]|nr:ABC transporter permease [Chlamydiota bacterium]